MIRRHTPLRRSSVPRRTARPRRKRKSSVAALRRRLWDAVSRRIKETWGNTCFTCGATGLEGKNWHTAHFVNAGLSAAVRYDPDNLRPSCGRCNIWLRGNLAEYAIRLMDQIGEAKFRALLDRSRRLKQWKAHELEALISAAEKGGAEYEMAYYEMVGV